MSTDPEKRMDELLKAYALKRRTDAGTSLEMDGATRRLLQSEVARTLSQQPKLGTRFQGLAAFWPRLALGGAALVLLAVMSLIWFRIDRHPATRLDLAQASDTRHPPQTPERGNDSKALPKSPETAAPESPIPSPSQAPVSAPLAIFTAAPAPAPALAEKNDSRLERVALNSLTPAKASPAPQLRSEPVPARSPALASVANDRSFTFANGLAKGSKGQFAQADSRARFRRNFNSPPLPNVLQSFEIQRDGSNVLVIDADGSIYNGSVQNSPPAPSQPPAQTRSGVAPEPLVRDTSETIVVRTAASDSDVAAPNRTQGLDSEAFFFQATGTNRSLRQRVVFTGNYQAFANGRIEGKAIIGSKNEVRIEANQVGP